MTTNIARSFARYIALPVVSAGVIGGAALGLAGMANAATTVTQNGGSVAIVTSPDTYAKPAPTAIPAGTTTTASAASRCSTSEQLNRSTSNSGPPRRGQLRGASRGMSACGQMLVNRQPAAIGPGEHDCFALRCHRR